MRLGLTETAARRSFKSNAGQNNHFLITALVGLDNVRSGNATLNAEFSTSWNPKDVRRSADRSREYLLKTSLTWIADLVDVYRKRASSMAGLLSKSQKDAIQAEDGASKRLQRLAKDLHIASSGDLALARLGMQWRNSIVHSDAVGNLDNQIRSSLLRDEDYFAANYQGLRVNELVDRMEHKQPPRFKEVTAVIRASHQVVQQMDAQVIATINVNDYADWIVKQYVGKFATDAATNSFGKMWSGSTDKTIRRMAQLFKQEGIVPVAPDANCMSDDFWRNLVELSASEAKERFRSHATA